MTTAAIIVAAGRGTRAGGGVPKQFRPLGGRAVLDRTTAALAIHPAVGEIVVVLHPADRALFDRHVTAPPGAVLRLADGGATRDASVRAGLAAVSDRAERVLIHDGARPLVTRDMIGRILVALDDAPGAAPALPVTDALWTGQDGRVTGTSDREGLFRAQTPQGFRLQAICAAHAAWPEGRPAADDVEIALAHGIDVAIVEGEEDNIKITHAGDFARAEAILRLRKGD